MIDARNVKHSSSDGRAQYCYCIRYSSNPLKLQYILCPFNFGSFCNAYKQQDMLPEKKGELVLLGKSENKENQWNLRGPLHPPLPTLSPFVLPGNTWFDWIFFLSDTEMSKLRRSPTLQVSWTVYFRLMLNHLTTEQARRTHRE